MLRRYERNKKKEPQKVRKFHLFSRGGSNIQLNLINDREEAVIALKYIYKYKNYLVKNPRLIYLIFQLTRYKMKNHNLIISSNMLRLISLNILSKNQDQLVIMRIGKAILLSTNKFITAIKFLEVVLIEYDKIMVATLPYVIFATLVYFNIFEIYLYNCQSYFEELEQSRKIQIFSEKPYGNVVIIDNPKSVEFYVLSKKTLLKIANVPSGKKVEVTKSYTKVRKKAKMVEFSSFKKTDSVLKALSEEPLVLPLQRRVENIENIIDEV